MPADTISILDGSTFLVSDLQGDVDATPQRVHGLFCRDTRFLSRWKLTLNGAPLELLSTDTETHYFSAQFFLVPSRAALGDDRYVSVIRKRTVGEGVHEDVEVINHNLRRVELAWGFRPSMEELLMSSLRELAASCEERRN